ncbi:MAG TPA: hypothetical protein VF916_12875, partial [Ktedonobacterales bacterium]
WAHDAPPRQIAIPDPGDPADALHCTKDHGRSAGGGRQTGVRRPALEHQGAAARRRLLHRLALYAKKVTDTPGLSTRPAQRWRARI